jgi:hypothetical protein
VRRVGLAVAFVSGLLAGCPGLSPYVCLADADCDRGGVTGVCLEDGTCAYADGECDSGLRRSPNAARDPGACVPVDPSGTTGVEDTGASMTGGPSDDASTGVQPGDCGWQLPIVVDTGVLTPGAAVEGYPLLLSLDAPGLATAIEATDEQPFVTDADGVALPHEWEVVDATTGEVTAWVRLPSYEAGEPLSLSLWLGVPPPESDPAEVWAGTYVGVWHLGDALTGTDDDPIRNSARADEPGFTGGQMQPEQSVEGLVGRGLSFDGVDDIVTIDASFVGQLESYTVSFWARHEGRGAFPSSYFQRLNGDYFYPRCWRLAEVDGGQTICQYQIDETIHPLGAGQVHEVDELIHIALVRDAAADRTALYVDGELVNTNDDPVGSLPDDGHAFELGHGEWGTYTGMIDELRVADRALPAAFFDADFRAHRNPASVLLEVGELQPAPCAGG